VRKHSTVTRARVLDREPKWEPQGTGKHVAKCGKERTWENNPIKVSMNSGAQPQGWIWSKDFETWMDKPLTRSREPTGGCMSWFKQDEDFWRRPDYWNHSLWELECKCNLNRKLSEWSEWQNRDDRWNNKFEDGSIEIINLKNKEKKKKKNSLMFMPQKFPESKVLKNVWRNNYWKFSKLSER
jgi:hypothetical protein